MLGFRTVSQIIRPLRPPGIFRNICAAKHWSARNWHKTNSPNFLARDFSTSPTVESSQDDSYLKVFKFLENEKKVPVAIAREVVGTLKEAGLGKTENEMIGAIVSMGESGFSSLVSSIEMEQTALKDQSLKPDVSFTVVIPGEGQRAISMKGKEGESLYDLCLNKDSKLRNYLECACDGKMMCSTCHVYLDKTSHATLGIVSEAELDMLDLAFGYNEALSRLGCQVKLCREIDGMVVTIPLGVNNYFNK